MLAWLFSMFLLGGVEVGWSDKSRDCDATVQLIYGLLQLNMSWTPNQCESANGFSCP